MALRQIWLQGGAIGIESAFGTAPTANTPWFGGGKYFGIPITAFDLDGKFAKSMPQGIAGVRERHAYGPVPGNKLSQGTVRGDILAAPLGVLLKMALGAVSSTPTADAANPLKAAGAALTSNITSITNPTTSAYLYFTISSAAGSNMTLTVSGTDANGDSVSEVIPVAAGDSTVQTRYSYDTLTDQTVVVSGFSGGTCKIDGYIKSAHTITLANTPVSYTILNKGAAGRGSSQDGFHKGIVLQSLRLNFDAGSENAPFTYDATFIGKYPVYASEATVYPPYGVPFGGWMLAVTREGVAYAKVQRGFIQIDCGNNVIWVADASQDPADMVGGYFAVSGEFVLMPEDDTEWGDYEDNSERDFHLTFTNTLDALDATNDKSLLLELTRTYYTEARPIEVEGVQGIQVGFATVRDSSDGAIKATLTNHVHSYA